MTRAEDIIIRLLLILAADKVYGARSEEEQTILEEALYSVSEDHAALAEESGLVSEEN
jgi:hypothetical protein